VPIKEPEEPVSVQREPVDSYEARDSYEPQRSADIVKSIELTKLLRTVFEQHQSLVVSKKIKFSLLVSNDVPLVIRANERTLTLQLRDAFTEVFGEAGYGTQVNAEASLLPASLRPADYEASISFDFYYNSQHKRIVLEANRDSEH